MPIIDFSLFLAKPGKSVLAHQIYEKMAKWQRLHVGKAATITLSKLQQRLKKTCKLLEVGFEYVQDVDRQKVFRKRRWKTRPKCTYILAVKP